MPRRVVESSGDDSDYLESESEPESDPIEQAVTAVVTSAHVRLKLKPHPVRAYLGLQYFQLHKKANPDKSLECPVCLEPINCPHCFELWSCGHYLHRHCSAEIENSKCPLCR